MLATTDPSCCESLSHRESLGLYVHTLSHLVFRENPVAPARHFSQLTHEAEHPLAIRTHGLPVMPNQRQFFNGTADL